MFLPDLTLSKFVQRSEAGCDFDDSAEGWPLHFQEGSDEDWQEFERHLEGFWWRCEADPSSLQHSCHLGCESHVEGRFTVLQASTNRYFFKIYSSLQEMYFFLRNASKLSVHLILFLSVVFKWKLLFAGPRLVSVVNEGELASVVFTVSGSSKNLAVRMEKVEKSGESYIVNVSLAKRFMKLELVPVRN